MSGIVVKKRGRGRGRGRGTKKKAGDSNPFGNLQSSKKKSEAENRVQNGNVILRDSRHDHHTHKHTHEQKLTRNKFLWMLKYSRCGQMILKIFSNCASPSPRRKVCTREFLSSLRFTYQARTKPCIQIINPK